MFGFLFGFLLILLIFSVALTLSVGLFSYIIFGESIILIICTFINASITGILLLIVAIRIIISCVECFIDDHLRK